MASFPELHGAPRLNPAWVTKTERRRDWRRHRKRQKVTRQGGGAFPELQLWIERPREEEKATEWARHDMQPPRYVMLAEQSRLRSPPHRRNLPRYYSGRSKGDGGGCCCCLLLLFLIAIYKPQLPSYSVESLSVGDFEFDHHPVDRTKLVAMVSAVNPNEMIGITYGEGSRVMVTYQDTVLCDGKLPSFYQGQLNKTVMRVEMEGHSFPVSIISTTPSSTKEVGCLLRPPL
ncbi:hypothetical protein B296_00021403 [Ensete ventricosum]|uniref:Late embryogenesis abundant protein LEA-2 subgroup domain-containing protein n=1 Tax=Ensete ventricosum TaxID=4639 RepID=A0A427AK54_ENSVE|nr:hypothetical protein B296_00021403 [Ensete ventricosum]